MTHRLMVVPGEAKINLKSAVKKIVATIKKQGKTVAIFEPFGKQGLSEKEINAYLVRNQLGDLLEKLEGFYRALPKADVVVIVGLPLCPCAFDLNVSIATAFDATVIVCSKCCCRMKMTAHAYRFVKTIACKNVTSDWIRDWLSQNNPRRLTPPAFNFELIDKARKANKRIILPEGAEPRTIEAASICAKRKIARCILLGKPNEIKKVARDKQLDLTGVEILEPDHEMIERYVAPMVECRKAKGLKAEEAREQLNDTVVLGTMMLKLGEVDGLVSGAVHTTANTIRPALQLIKTRPESRLVSSVFFMCLPEQVYVFGDCAINPNPSPNTLADITIQSAESAKMFGIEPRVAMISYSTGQSGAGPDVDLVIEATRIAKERRPDLLIDGPLQYDAAYVEKVGKSKAPNSPVAGRATVFVFPDLNTGNTVYKAVQRAANIVAVGPMMQGLRKPVNDLSRGCLVEDIVFTIALTAIQAIN